MISTETSSRSSLLLWTSALSANISFFASCVLWFSMIVRIDAFTQPSHRVMASRTTSSFTMIYSAKHVTDEQQASVAERVRAAVFQAPLSHSENPLEILTEVADSLRVASLHGVDVVVYPELYLSGPNNSKALDRESYELNIVGNMCGELNVACVIGYVEAVHESEMKTKKDDSSDDSKSYNSIAAFHADGSRAGNYRSVSASTFRKGSPFVEFIPTTLRLPNRETSKQSSEREREIKVGMMCGNDILKPEHSLHLVRCGAQIIFAPSSFKNNDKDSRLLKYVTVTRAIENSVPFVFANGESAAATDDTEDGDDFIGSSAIISKDGDYLVCGPQEEGGDMPSDSGYLIPSKHGAIYAADIDVDTSRSSVIQQSIDKWDLNPLVPDVIGDEHSEEKKRKESNGFGNYSGKKINGKKKLKK